MAFGLMFLGWFNLRRHGSSATYIVRFIARTYSLVGFHSLMARNMKAEYKEGQEARENFERLARGYSFQAPQGGY